MDNLDDIMGAYERHRQAQAALNETNKGAVFDALAAAGITEVGVDFDGAGDNGQIESVTAHRGKDRVDLPRTTVAIQVSWGATKIVTTELSLDQAIETLCYGYLEETHGGWENNDGAYGEFTFHVAARTIELDFHGRYTDTWTDNHSF